MEEDEIRMKNFQINTLYRNSQEIFRNILAEMDPDSKTLDLSKLIRTINLNSINVNVNEKVKNILENYHMNDTILNSDKKEFNHKLTEREFCNFISGKEMKKVLFENNQNENKDNKEEILTLYNLMGGDKDGISIDNLDKAITKVINFYACPDLYMKEEYDPEKEKNDFKGEAEDIIKMLGQKDTDKLSLDDFMNIMTCNFNEDFDRVIIDVPVKK